MSNNRFILLFTTVFFFLSCNTGNGRQNTATGVDSQAVKSTYDASLVKAIVTDTVVCRRDNTQTYALYLPSGYTPTRAYPCVYFFDAHARGSLPVRAYKEIAEKYGFVLIGSNNSQNGTPWPVTNGWVTALFEDTRGRINIDAKRIYTSGFSGGSRVASSIAIFDGGVAGVIGCAAGFPQVQDAIKGKFDYFGIVGDYDFNFSEMEQLDKMLDQNGFAHQLLTSSGIHGWPLAGDFCTALIWMQVNAMKEHIQPHNDTLISAIKSDFDKNITAARTMKDLEKEHDLLTGIIRLLDGLADVTTYRRQLTDINNTKYKSAISETAKLRQEETGQQQEIQKQFATQNQKWLTDKIKQLNQNAQHAKTVQEAQMNKRVLNFLGFVAYMYTNHALKERDLTHAECTLKIFKLADPHNPDGGYLSATYYMQKGDTKQAIVSLNESAALGFNEVAKLLADPAFRGIASNDGFKEVVNKVRKNYLEGTNTQ